MNFAEHIMKFIKHLQFNIDLPDGIEVMNPFKDKKVLAICKQFYEKYYADNNKRWMIIGINPGRFGGGVTGIPFTDPIRLHNECCIENDCARKQELSSLFIYDMISACGGPEMFYKKFYFTSVSPLGFTKGNKNLNYYDDRQLEKSIEKFVINCMEKQLKFGIQTNVIYCLGEGKNFSYVSKLNDKYKFFDEVIPLSHPRFIMQYRLKRKGEYITKYQDEFLRTDPAYSRNNANFVE